MPSAYLDHAASTPMRPAALAALVDALEHAPGNPSGSHRAARTARRLLDDARDQVAAFVGAEPGDVVLTSGGTEADNLAVGGLGAAPGPPMCLATDHHAVLAPVLAAEGCKVPVQRDGLVDLDALIDLLRGGPPPRVVSLALANNETGVVQPLDDVAAAVRRHAPGAALHVDAVAAAAWLDLTSLLRSVDAVSLSAHKVGGPKGVGALVVRTGVALAPTLRGGGQERERRSGTQNVAGAVAMGVALAATAAERAAAARRILALRDELEAALARAGGRVTSAAAPRLPNLVHTCWPGIEREEVLFRLDAAGIAASGGSSCASGALEPSHVLVAMGVDPVAARGALRLSLGWSTTEAEVAHAAREVPAAVAALRTVAGVAP